MWHQDMQAHVNKCSAAPSAAAPPSHSKPMQTSEFRCPFVIVFTCTAMNAVSSHTMPGDAAIIVKVVSKVGSIAQLLCGARAANRSIERPLLHQITILCTEHSPVFTRGALLEHVDNTLLCQTDLINLLHRCFWSRTAYRAISQPLKHSMVSFRVSSI